MKIHSFVFVVFVPVLAVITAMFFFFTLEFNKVRESSEQLTQTVVPSILNAQRTFVNIDGLRYHASTIHTRIDRDEAKDAYIDCQSIISEIAMNDTQLPHDKLAAMMSQLHEFWKVRLNLEQLQDTVMGKLYHLYNLRLLILHDSGRSAKYEPEHLDALSSSMQSLSSDSVKLYDRLKHEANDTLGTCAGVVPEKVSGMCSVYDTEYREMQSKMQELDLKLQDFNAAYEKFGESINELVVISSQIETTTLDNRLLSITDVAGTAEPMVLAALGVLSLLMVVAYLMIYHFISRPLAEITSIILMFRKKMERPEFFPTSSITEIESINSVLPQLFDEMRKQALELRDSNESYQNLLNVSVKDALTGVYNRKALEDMIDATVQVEPNLSIYMIDIDNFKFFNDRMGHQYGDKILSTIAEVLERNLPENGTAYRYGGEEFLLIVRGLSLEERESFGRKLCDAVLALEVKNEANSNGLMSISVGCSDLTTTSFAIGYRTLIKQADIAMYAAKQGGRNRVVLYDPQMGLEVPKQKMR